MDDDAPSTSLNPDSPPFHPPPQPFLRPPIIILPNYFTPPPSPIIISHNFPHTCPTYPLPFHPAYHHQYHSLPPPLQFSNNTHLVAPPPLLPQSPQFLYSHYFEQQPPPQEEWADSRSFQDATASVSVGPRISSCRQSNFQRPEIGERSSRRRKKNVRRPAPRIPEDQPRTTIVIKNIPNYFTRESLLQFMDNHCRRENERDKEFISAYDFLYLPIDFSSGKNRGFAFVNFTSTKAVWKFYEAYDWKPWPGLPLKFIKIESALNYQGKEALVAHHENLIFRCDIDEYLPLLLEPPSSGSRAQVNLRLVGKRISPSFRRRSPH